MSRDVPFDEHAVCDECGAFGAFDFMGDYLCPECIKKSDKCSYDPRETKGQPLGMYHCPECGNMVIAGMKHPDYSILENDNLKEK